MRISRVQFYVAQALTVAVGLGCGSAQAQHPVRPIETAEILPTRAAVRETKALSIAGRAATDKEKISALVARGYDEFTAECVLDAENAGKLSYGCHGFAGLSSSEEAKRYYGGLSIADVVALGVGNDRSTLYTELVSDNLFTLAALGFARVGFGALVASDDTTHSTLQQFFEAGGNAIGYVELPFYRWVNAVTDGDSIRPLRRADFGLTTAVRGDLPAGNKAVEELAGNIYVGARLDAIQHSTTDQFRFFLTGNGGWVRGTDGFYDNLDVNDAPEWGTWTAKLTLGVDVARWVRIGASRGWSGLDGVNLKWRLSAQLLPQPKN